MTTLEEWEREDDSMAPALPELKAITRFLLGMGMELRTAGRLPHGPRALEGPRADAMFLRLRFLAMDVARADRNERTGALAADQIKETQQALADLRRPLDWLTKLANPLARGGMNMALEARRTKIERELAEIELADPHVRGEIEAALRAAGLQIDGGLAIAGAAESPADRRYREMCLKRELAIVNLVAGLFLFGADDVLAVLDQAFAAGLANKLERQSDGRLKTGPEKLADRLTATAADICTIGFLAVLQHDLGMRFVGAIMERTNAGRERKRQVRDQLDALWTLVTGRGAMDAEGNSKLHAAFDRLLGDRWRTAIKIGRMIHDRMHPPQQIDGAATQLSE